MEKYPVSSLIKNRYFSRPLFLEEKYILLASETPVTDQLIARLDRWNYQFTLSDGEQVEGLVMDQSASPDTGFGLEVEMKEQAEFGKAFKAYQTFVNQTEDLFADYLNKGSLSSERLTNLIRTIIDAVKDQGHYILRTTEMTLEDKDYLVVHSVRTTIYSMAVGLHYKFPNHRLIELGIGSLLHEIGMIKLPSQLYMSNKILTPQERKAISAHPVLGFRILREAELPMTVCNAVLESREYVDGSGYPRGLIGDKISPYAKIISICSTFAALTSPRPYRHAFDGHQSMMEIIKGINKKYDDKSVKAFLKMVSLYPIGTFVQVANGAIGMVIQANEANPKEPIIRLQIAPNGDKLTDALVVKAEGPEYVIVKAFTTPQVTEIKRKYNLSLHN